MGLGRATVVADIVDCSGGAVGSHGSDGPFFHSYNRLRPLSHEGVVPVLILVRVARRLLLVLPQRWRGGCVIGPRECPLRWGRLVLGIRDYPTLDYADLVGLVVVAAFCVTLYKNARGLAYG